MVVREEKIRVTVEGADRGARDIDKLGKSTDRLGDELGDTKRDASALDRELDRLQGTVKDLSRQFERTGDKGLLQQIKDAKKELGPLQSVRRELDRIAAADAKVRSQRVRLPGTSPESGVRAMLGGLNVPLSPQTLGLAGIGGAIAAPALGAGITAAGLLGAGGLVAGGGIALAASSNQNVQDAFASTGTEVLDSLKSMSHVFEKPLVQSARIARREWRAMRGDIEEMFSDVADSGGIEGFTEGLTGLVRNALPGLESAAETFGEFGEIARQSFPELGKSISHMFDMFERGAPGATAFFHDLVTLTGSTAEGIGNVSLALSKTYEFLDEGRDRSAFGQLTQGVTGFSRVIGEAQIDTEDFVDAHTHLQRALKKSNDAFDDLFNTVYNSRSAARDYEESVDDLTESFKENGRALDIGTETGRNNQAAIETVIARIQQQREAAIAAGDGSYEATLRANDQYARQIGLLETQLRQLGLTERQIAEIVEQYRAIPSLKETTLHVRAVYSGPIPTKAQGIINPAEALAVALDRRASGGPVEAGRPYLVGEQGPELITPTRSGFVHDAASTARMGTAAGRTAPAPQQVTLRVVGDDRALVDLIRRLVVVEGGGDVQVAFGR